MRLPQVLVVCRQTAITSMRRELHIESMSNMNRFSFAVNRFGIVPWAVQVTQIRMILDKAIEENA